MPRGVASIDPQDSLFFPTDRVSGSLAALPLPHHAHRASSPLLPLPFPPRYRRVPLRRPDHPSWFTSLFTVSLSHLPARLSHTLHRLPHRGRLLSSVDAEPHHHHRHHHPDGGVALLGRSIEADVLSSNHAESDRSDELLRIRGWIPRQPFEWRSKPSRWKREREAPHRRDFGFLPEDDCVKFLRRHDFITFIEIKYTKYTTANILLCASLRRNYTRFISLLDNFLYYILL